MSQVAQIIFQQLGGNRFAAMTGAKNFVGGENFIQFKVRGAKGVNSVKVTLNAKDLYNVLFMKVTNYGLDVKYLSKFEDIDCEQLAPLFEKQTGLYVKF